MTTPPVPPGNQNGGPQGPETERHRSAGFVRLIWRDAGWLPTLLLLIAVALLISRLPLTPQRYRDWLDGYPWVEIITAASGAVIWLAQAINRRRRNAGAVPPDWAVSMVVLALLLLVVQYVQSARITTLRRDVQNAESRASRLANDIRNKVDEANVNAKANALGVQIATVYEQATSWSETQYARAVAAVIPEITGHEASINEARSNVVERTTEKRKKAVDTLEEISKTPKLSPDAALRLRVAVDLLKDVGAPRPRPAPPPLSRKQLEDEGEQLKKEGWAAISWMGDGDGPGIANLYYKWVGEELCFRASYEMLPFEELRIQKSQMPEELLAGGSWHGQPYQTNGTVPGWMQEQQVRLKPATEREGRIWRIA